MRESEVGSEALPELRTAEAVAAALERNPEALPALLAVSEVADVLDVDEAWVESRWLLLPAVLHGGLMHVRREDLAEWAEAARPKRQERRWRPPEPELHPEDAASIERLQRRWNR